MVSEEQRQVQHDTYHRCRDGSERRGKAQLVLRVLHQRAAAEYENIEVEISLLSALDTLSFTDAASALAQLTPHVHGVIFHYGHHRSTYLPQVWENFSDPAMFLATLKQKAGLPPNFWDASVKLQTYTVAKLRESV